MENVHAMGQGPSFVLHLQSTSHNRTMVHAWRAWACITAIIIIIYLNPDSFNQVQAGTYKLVRIYGALCNAIKLVLQGLMAAKGKA